MTKSTLLFASVAMCVFAASPTVPSAEPTPAWVGARGPNGTGIYPGARPPTTWDMATGQNVRWVLPLNGWGHGQPVVGGDRVFLMLESDVNHLFPRLQCLDLATGKLLWEDELDHLPVAEPDPTKRAAIYKRWQEQLQRINRGHQFRIEYRQATTPEQKQALVKQYTDKGFSFEMRGGQHTNPTIVVPNFPAEKAATKMIGRYGLWDECYARDLGFACIGKTFGAPIWDPKENAVYAVVAGGVFAKYDAAGKRQWLTWAFKPGLAALGQWGDDTMARHPILHGDLLIGTTCNNLVAIDKSTGKVRFQYDMKLGPGAYEGEKGLISIASPVVLTVAGTDILLTAGSCAYRLPEGQPLKVEGWLISGMQALVKHDERDVLFFCGAGEHSSWPGKGRCDTPPPAAVRYRLDGDTLRGQVLWAGVQCPEPKSEAAMGGTAPWLLYNDGRLYHRGGTILDALSGKILAGSFSRQARDPDIATPGTDHLLQLANGHVYGWGDYAFKGHGNPQAGGLKIFTADGKFVARMLFPTPVMTQEQLPIWNGMGAGSLMSYSWQFTFGPDCLVARGLMHLYCFGAPVSRQKLSETE